MMKKYTREELIKAFWSRTKVNEETGCIEWQRSRTESNGRGYGSSTPIDGERHAHRIAWVIANGPIPKCFVLDHLCRNPLCVNVEHLEPVTHQSNVQRGSAAKLTAEDVVLIRMMYASNHYSLTIIAEKFQIATETVGYIVRGESWSNVGGPITKRGRGRFKKTPLINVAAD
jgi:hypothetical protein